LVTAFLTGFFFTFPADDFTALSTSSVFVGLGLFFFTDRSLSFGFGAGGLIRPSKAQCIIKPVPGCQLAIQANLVK
jgi:hypothetical protein